MIDESQRFTVFKCDVLCFVSTSRREALSALPMYNGAPELIIHRCHRVSEVSMIGVSSMVANEKPMTVYTVLQ